MNYQPLIYELSTHAQLHLEFYKLNQRPRHVPVATRNAVLGKYIKEKLKLPKYKLIKKDMKSLVLLSKKPNANIEQRLDNLLSLHSTRVTNHLDAFFYVVAEIERAWNTDFKMIPPDTLELSEIDNKALIIPTANIGAHFSEDENELVEPITFLCRGSERYIEMLENMINPQWFTHDRVTTVEDASVRIERLMIKAKVY